MKKISLLTATAVAGLVSAEAATCNPSGFFIGLNAGVQMTGAKLRFNTDQVVNDETAEQHNRSFNTDFGNKNADFVAELMAGYNMLYSGAIILGVHFYIGYNNTSMKHTTDQVQTEIQSQFDEGVYNLTHKVKRSSDFFYGIGIRLGYLLNARTILSIMLNAERSKWKLSAAVSNVPSVNSNENNNTTGNQSVSKSKSKVSFAPAIELATFITKQVSINLRYKCVFGPSITVKGPAGNETRDRTTLHRSTSKVKVRDHQFTIGVSYKTN